MREKDRPGKLFVGGLALEITEERLEKAFGKYGRITEAIIIRDKIHHQSRGFGFVTYENPQDSFDALKGLDNSELSGSTLHVTEAVVSSGRGGGRGDDMSGPRRGSFSSRGRGGPPRRGGGFSSRGRGGPPPSYSKKKRENSKSPKKDKKSPKSKKREREESFERRDTYDRGGRERSPLLSRGPPPSRDGGYGDRDDDLPPRRVSDYEARAPPPIDRREDRYGSPQAYAESRSSYPPPARREYRSPPRERGGLLDDRPPPASRYTDSLRDYPPPSRDYAPAKSYSPPRERAYPAETRGEYASGYAREERRETYARPSPSSRDYPPPRSEYPSRDYPRDPVRDPASAPPRDSYSSRDSYPPPRRDYPESRDYSGSNRSFSSRDDVAPPPPREMYRDSAPPSRYDSGSKSEYSSRAPVPSSRGPPSRGPPSSDRYGGDRNGYNDRREASGPPRSRSRMDERSPRGRPPMRR